MAIGQAVLFTFQRKRISIEIHMTQPEIGGTSPLAIDGERSTMEPRRTSFLRINREPVEIMTAPPLLLGEDISKK
jgi:hypothetical protein